MANVPGSHLSSTHDISPDALEETSQDASYTTSRVKRMVGQTVDKLSRSISGKAGRTSPNPATTPPPSAGHRRLFSLSRKGKGKDLLADNDSKRAPNLVTYY
jgi:hypothetical protein